MFIEVCCSFDVLLVIAIVGVKEDQPFYAVIAGGYKEMSSILADQYPKCGGRGELRGL
jgi:hypothetical protein